MPKISSFILFKQVSFESTSKEKIMELKFRKPTINDLEEMTKVMRKAFDDDAKKHLNEEAGGPPGYNNGDFYKKWLFNDKYSQGIIAELNGKIVAAAIVYINKNKRNVLGNICVDPDYQDRNIGTVLWNKIESMDKSAYSWTLDTPAYALKNHHFYSKKCGFTKTKEHPDDCPGRVSFVFTKVL